MSVDEARQIRSYSRIEHSRWSSLNSIGPSGRDVAAPSGQRRSAYVDFGFKRLLDIVCAAVALVFLLPTFPLIFLALLVQDGLPILFSQPRVGFGGRHFNCLKFRSMARDAEQRLQTLIANDRDARDEWETTQKLKADPRIHWIGELIRKSSIDELPQLINVLRGDMSIVGPRPILLSQVPLYGPGYRSYTSMRPGITGLWQVSGRNELTFSERTDCDVEYAKDVTFLGDLRIIGKTFLVVFKGSGSF